MMWQIDPDAGSPRPSYMPTPMIMEPVLHDDRLVNVGGVLPGAGVELQVLRGGAVVNTAQTHADESTASALVELEIALQTGDTLLARQTQEDQVSPAGAPATVVAAPAFGPRPFYIVGHNPNSISQVLDALNQGANTVEPDVNVYADYEDQLCISHGEGSPDAPELTAFLTDLHTVAQERPELSLVVFDCKPKTAKPQHGKTLLDAIRQHLTHDLELNIIISVSSLENVAIFDQIKTGLGPREALMVDEENDPVAVAGFFTRAGVVNQGYGNGISFMNAILGPHVRPSMEQACEFRAAGNCTRFIYVWTVDDDDLLREYIRIGVDGIITDRLPALWGIVGEAEFTNLIRLATRSDNPFAPANFAYGLLVHTADIDMGGTDANITFTLTGTAGSASMTVNMGLRGRMERGSWNYITLQSPNLGDLQSMTVQRDDSGSGRFPGPQAHCPKTRRR